MKYWTVLYLLLQCNKALSGIWPFYSSCEEGEIVLKYSVRGKLRNGSVFLCDRGEWRAVCDDNWDVNDAKVVCRQMGFAAGAVPLYNSRFGTFYDYRGITNFNCLGTESRLSECGADRLSCSCSMFGFAAAECSDASPACSSATCPTCDCTPEDSTQNAMECPVEVTEEVTPPTTATAAVVLINVMLFLILVGVAMGWVWSCYKNRTKSSSTTAQQHHHQTTHPTHYNLARRQLPDTPRPLPQSH